MPVVLALETSSPVCSVALRAGDLDDQIRAEAGREHHRKLLPMIEELLTRNDLKIADIDVIAYGEGPGSFTGLRIGAGVVQGLAFARRKPVIGISSLQALALAVLDAHQGAPDPLVLVAVDAHMNDIYRAVYKAGAGSINCIAEANVVSADNGDWLEPYQGRSAIMAGDAWAKFTNLATSLEDAVVSDLIYPNAACVARLAHERSHDDWRDASQAQPVYVRGTDQWKTIEQQRGDSSQRSIAESP